jgi:hypothetical protein
MFDDFISLASNGTSSHRFVQIVQAKKYCQARCIHSASPSLHQQGIKAWSNLYLESCGPATLSNRGTYHTQITINTPLSEQ